MDTTPEAINLGSDTEEITPADIRKIIRNLESENDLSRSSDFQTKRSAPDTTPNFVKKLNSEQYIDQEKLTRLTKKFTKYVQTNFIDKPANTTPDESVQEGFYQYKKDFFKSFHYQDEQWGEEVFAFWLRDRVRKAWLNSLKKSKRNNQG